jgi:hypothetical protein
MKTLEQAEPRIPIGPDTTPGDATAVYVITEPGSYYLTGNVAGEPGKNGIRISPSVGLRLFTIDLNGFSLIGVPGSLEGISTLARCNVRNGSADLWGGNGITIGSGTVENVSAIFNGAIGIRAGSDNLIVNCRAISNGSHGISCADVSTVRNCVSANNAGRGLNIDGVGTVTDSVFYANDAGGILTGVATISGCTFFSNSGPTIEDIGRSHIFDNDINAGATGILTTGPSSRVERNNVSGCSIGFQATGTGAIFTANTASACTTPFDIGAGNRHGPIIDATATDDLSTLTGADNPTANLVY